jgi:hypothetical protein
MSFKMRGGKKGESKDIQPILCNKKIGPISKGKVRQGQTTVQTGLYHLVSEDTILLETDYDKIVHVDANENTVQLQLPKISRHSINRTIIIRRSDSGDNGNDVLIFPNKGDTIEKGSPDGSWIPDIGTAFGIGFGDICQLSNDGLNNWFFLSKPKLDTINIVHNRDIHLHDLDRTVIIKTQKVSNVYLPTAVGKGGRIINIKNNPVSLSNVRVIAINSQTIDGYASKTLKPGYCLGMVSDDNGWNIIYGYLSVIE